MKKIVLAILCALALTFTMSAKNRALLIGVGGYNTSATGWGKISSVNDIDLLKPKFVALGYEVSSLTDAEATKAKVVSALKVLSGKTVAGDNIYLHFSGHGQLIEDLNGDEFADYDQCLYVSMRVCLPISNPEDVRIEVRTISLMMNCSRSCPFLNKKSAQTAV